MRILAWTGVAAATLAPLTTGPYVLYLAAWAAINAMLAMGLNLTLGYAGQISLAQAAFMGIGAYAVAIVGPAVGFWGALALGALLAFAAGWALGVPALRVRTHSLAMVTLGFGVVFFLAARNLERLTGGSFGLSGIPRPGLGPWSLASDRAYYLLVLAATVGVALGVAAIARSPWGRAFRAIRANERRAEACGVSLRAYKLWAFALGAGSAGLAGGLFAPLLGYIDPNAFTLERSFLILLMVVLGGLGRLAGPVVGAVVVTLLPEALRVTQGLYLIIFSGAVVACVLFWPRGLCGVWDRVVGRETPGVSA